MDTTTERSAWAARSHELAQLMSRSALGDRTAFARSIDHLLSWDFDRIAMAHGEIVTSHGKTMLIDALRERDLLP